MTSAASHWRQGIAAKIGPVYASHPSVAAVLLGGSTARGHADHFSDIEMGVFWHVPPTDEERRSFIDRMQVDLVRLYPYDPAEEVWEDDFMVGRGNPSQERSGVLVELAHYTTDFVERTLQAVLVDFDPDLLKQNLVSAIVDGIPLAGGRVVEAWSRRAALYPDGLAKAMVERNGVIDHFWRWKMYMDRGENLMLLHQMFSQAEQQVLKMLLGINRAYYFGFKWLDVLACRLPLAPENLVPRLRSPFKAQPEDGARQVSALVEETFDLVQAALPAVDVERLRRIFRYQRPILDEPPEF